MKHWMVVTPEYGEVIPILDDGTGPEEWGADVVFVEAETKRRALVEGVRELRRIHSHWMEDQYSNVSNPFTGLKAEISECQHGKCWCELPECPDKGCTECDRISEEEFNKLYPE